MIRRLTLGALVLAAVATLAATVSAATASTKGVVTITCQECEPSATDVFSQSWYNVVQEFNAKYKGKYHVNVQHYGGGTNDLPYWERLELANRLPDIFIIQSTELATLTKTGKILTFRRFLPPTRPGRARFSLMHSLR